MLANNHPRKRGKTVRLTLMNSHLLGTEHSPLTVKRRKALEMAEEAREQYGQDAEKLLDEVYPAGPSALKSSEGFRILATRRIDFDEPTFG